MNVIHLAVGQQLCASAANESARKRVYMYDQLVSTVNQILLNSARTQSMHIGTHAGSVQHGSTS